VFEQVLTAPLCHHNALCFIYLKPPSSKYCRSGFRLRSFWNSLFHFTFISPTFFSSFQTCEECSGSNASAKPKKKVKSPSPLFSFHLLTITAFLSFRFRLVFLSLLTISHRLLLPPTLPPPRKATTMTATFQKFLITCTCSTALTAGI
jgi:hypothetical protein